MADPVAFHIDDLPKLATFRERSAEIRTTVKETHETLAGAGWTTLRDTACGKLIDGLKHEDGLAWLAFAWTKAKEVKEAAKETLGEGAPERLVPLAAHSLSQDICPVVTLSCGPAELELKFTIALSGDIDCADLVVRGGRLVAIQAGQLTPAAALSFRGVPLGEKKGDPIDLLKPYLLPRGGFRIVDEQAAAEGSPLSH